jgi:hypothetical protein
MHTLQEYETLRIEFVDMSHNCFEYGDSKDIGFARLVLGGSERLGHCQ